MNIDATMFLFCVSGCFGIPKSPDEAYDSLFEVSGYPKTGDVPTLNRKIFRGTRVTIREHPYVVSIRRQFAHYVTGTLLTSTLILTVAHPLYLVPIQELGAVLGENYADRGTLIHTVIVLVVHDKFDPYTLHNDIAVLKIYETGNLRFYFVSLFTLAIGILNLNRIHATAVEISEKFNRTSAKIIKLISVMPLNGTKAFVTGWGRCDMTHRELCLPRGSIYFPDEKFDPMLRTVIFEITTPNYYCNGYKRQGIILHAGMLCMGEAREENPVAPCLAVPGAPLVVLGRLAGLQSWGFGCGYSHDLPLVYTSTQYYERWIGDNVEVFNTLTQDNYTELFKVTRAYISYSWLAQTRLVKPDGHNDFPRELQQAAIDKVLCNLKGNYYDIRDFIDNGWYSESKFKIINDICWNRKKLAMINKTRTKFSKGVPFISKYLLANDENDDSEKFEDSEIPS